MDDTNILAVFLGAVFGVACTSAFTMWYAARERQRETTTVATALLTEVLLQADFIELISHSVRAALTSGQLQPSPAAFRETLETALPPPPVMYHALADRVALLGPEGARNLIEFYGALAWLRINVNSLSIETNSERPAIAAALRRLQQIGQGAAWKGGDTIRRLETMAEPLPERSAAAQRTLKMLDKCASDAYWKNPAR